MYVTKPFTIEGNFVESAKKAILQAFKKNGYAPREVMVHPTTDTGGNTFIAVMLNGVMNQIPIRVRDDLKIGFSLDENQALLDVCNPFSNLE